MLHYADFRIDQDGEVLIVVDHFDYNRRKSVDITYSKGVLKGGQEGRIFLRLELQSDELKAKLRRTSKVSMCFIDLYGALQIVKHINYKTIGGA